jgi:protein TonB
MAYADKRAANPGALGLTIGLNAAAVLALALWNPNIVKQITKTITTIEIDPVSDPPPPPPPDDTKPRPKTKIDAVDPTVKGASKEVTTWVDPGSGPTIIIKDPGPDPIIDPSPPPQIRDTVKRPPAMATRPGDLQPPYPPALQRAEVEGSVTVRILIGIDGRPKDIVLVRADDADFFAAARTWGLRHWRFKPAEEDGTPVESWYTLTVKFNIER